MSTIAEQLQDLVEAKSDMKAALIEKGAAPIGGLTTYADAIRGIDTGDVIIEGNGIDYTEIGWSTDASIAQNELDVAIIEEDVNYSKHVMEYYKNGLGTTDTTASSYDGKWADLRHDIVYMPMIDIVYPYDLSAMFGAYAYQNTSRPLLKVFPSINTYNVTDMEYMFMYCDKLEKVGLLNCTSVRNIRGMFNHCGNLRHLDGFTNLGYCLVTSLSASYGTLDLSDCPKLTKESVLNVFNTIASGVASRNVTIILTASMLNSLSDEEKAIATNKGWTVTS